MRKLITLLLLWTSLSWGQIPSSINNPLLPNGANINPGTANGKCMADQQTGANEGAKITACINALPNGGFIDATGLTGSQAISSTVTVANAGTFILLAPNVSIAASACPAFDLTGPATTLWGWNSSGPTIIDSVGTQIKYSGSGCSGTPLVRFNINAGIRSGKILGIELDCNLKSANVSAGLSVGGSSTQDNRNVIEDVSITECGTGIVMNAGTQSTRFLRVHTQFVNTGVDMSAGNMRDIGFSACRFVADTLPVLIGTDDNVTGNQSTGIHFIDDTDLTLNSNGTGIMLVRNAQNVEWGSGWGEVTTGKTITQNAAVQIGSASSAPQGVSIHNVRFNMNGNAGENAIELVSGNSHQIHDNTFNNPAAGTFPVLNTAAGNNASSVYGNFGGAGSGGTPVSANTGILFICGNTIPANDLCIFGQGVRVHVGMPLQFSTDSGITRIAGGQFAFGNGTQGDNSGFIYAARHLIANSIQFQANTFRFGNLGVLGWSANADGENNAADASLSRTGVATVCVGNGTQGNCAGTLGLGKIQPANITTVAGGAPAIVYNTASSSVNANITAATMATAPATNANCPTNLTANCSVYELNWYIDLSAVGTSCTGSTTVVFNILFTDPLGAGQQTVASGTLTIATNGNGTLGTIVANGTQIIVAKLSTTVQYSTTSFTAGTGCSPAPKYQVTPILKQLS